MERDGTFCTLGVWGDAEGGQRSSVSYQPIKTRESFLQCDVNVSESLVPPRSTLIRDAICQLVLESAVLLVGS